MGRKAKYRNFTDAFRELAVRRMRECEDISALCRELIISRQLLYQWRDKLDRRQAKPDPTQATELQLRQQVVQLKQALAEKTLQVDFFKGALQKVEALRQSSTSSGAMASTPKSGN